MTQGITLNGNHETVNIVNKSSPTHNRSPTKQTINKVGALIYYKRYSALTQQSM